MIENNRTEILTKIFLVVVIVQVLVLIGLFVKLKFHDDVDLVLPTPIPTSTPSIEPTINPEEELNEIEIDIGSRISGTIEDIEFAADPKTINDTVWLVRLRFENAEVIEIRPIIGMMMPACSNNRSIDGDKVCSDIASSEPFVKGEKVFVVKVRWTGSGKVFRSIDDGYYNGQEVSHSNTTSRVAGVETASTAIVFPATSLVLFVVGSVLVFAAGIGFSLILNNEKKVDIKTNRKVTEGILTTSLVVMIIGTIFSIALFTNTVETTTETNSATPETETDYVYIYISPTSINVTLTPLPSLSPSVSISPSPAYPGLVYIYITVTPTPTLSPTPTPFTDNMYIACGPIDVNTDNRIDFYDYPPFRDAYSHICIDGPYLLGCGGKDTNTDNVINYIDLYYFISNYYPKTLNCTIY